MVYEVHVYVESDSTAPRKMMRGVGYVLECTRQDGELHTKEWFNARDGTYNEVVLWTLVKALQELNQPCEVHIHSQNAYILNMVGNNLEHWAGNGFRTAKGDLVKDHFGWERLWKEYQKHLVFTEPGAHGYYTWMLGQMAEAKKSAASSKY